jgi:flagellum-specific peptidoglycan hydrolase FlgJ
MSTAKTYSRKEFIDEYGSFIQKEIQGTGILFGTLVAQAIIESQGKVGSVYRVGGSTLSKQANNYFGIKKSSSWKGKTFNIDTGEVFNGNKVTVNADFRAYKQRKGLN